MQRGFYRLVFGGLLAVVTVGLLAMPPAHAVTPGDLAKKLADLQQQAQGIKNKLDQTKQQASDLQQAIQQLDDAIASNQDQINNTNEQVAVTSQVISQLNTQISEQQKTLDGFNSRLKSAYVSLYELSQTTPLEVMLQSQSLNELVSHTQYVQAIQTQLQGNITQVNSLLDDLGIKKGESEAQKKSLDQLNTSLQDAQDALGARKQQKDYLLHATNDQVTSYLSNYSDVQKRLTDVQRQLDTLIRTSSWGTDIISSDDPSWYYSQRAYPNTYMGNSPYTVSTYGCLVTSYAMVATFYGHAVTPVNIANDASNFDHNGYLIVQPPNPTHLSSVNTQPVNWGTVSGELASGHPVIVSIYLPSVGAINQDGSSHFVVIKAQAGSKYLMHDPLGDGRSYSLANVRSMKIIRP